MCWVKVWLPIVLHLRLDLLGQALYHDAFFMPGISPLFANSLKHIRHKEKSRKYPRDLPQRTHRRIIRVINLGVLCALAIKDVLAIL